MQSRRTVHRSEPPAPGTIGHVAPKKHEQQGALEPTQRAGLDDRGNRLWGPALSWFVAVRSTRELCRVAVRTEAPPVAIDVAELRRPDDLEFRVPRRDLVALRAVPRPDPPARA